jgi:prepilin-type N-terminal cleavage/methylation domain-containing protein
MNRNNQRGFTLVEIAIVLVIIGLLLGGILKGQELITSAKVRNLADQTSGVQAAYYGFVDRYRQIPGDMNNPCQAIGQTALPNCATAKGDGDGQIDDGSFLEASSVWAHLAGAGFINGAYAGGVITEAAYSAETIAPINAFGGRLLLARTDTYQGTSSARLNLTSGRNVPVNIMRELDVKLDNGQPQSGILRAASATGGQFAPVNLGEAGCVSTATTPATWDITTSSQDCNGIYLY